MTVTVSFGSGSSPLTRGKRLPDDAGDPWIRLIPAHAGKTTSWTAQRRQRRAHPRSRGENDWLRVWFAGTPGSSPLTRGKRFRGGRRKGVHRLIPAHAGKTRPWRRNRPCAPAHPRSRGENNSFDSFADSSAGSSPLTRGKPVKYADLIGMLRLIPAHAGKTRWPGPGSCRCPAHPRSRGENYTLMSRVSVRTGSSPLTRGKPLGWG